MKKIEKMGITITDLNVPPFFQVNQDYRVRFLMDQFRENGFKRLNNIIEDIFGDNKGIDTSFIYGYIVNGKKYPEAKGIGKFIHIRNWKEYYIDNIELESTVMYVTIENVDKQDIYKYCYAVGMDHREAYIVFYNDKYLMYVSSDVIDIVSCENSLIQQLKCTYKDAYDKYYETAENNF